MSSVRQTWMHTYVHPQCERERGRERREKDEEAPKISRDWGGEDEQGIAAGLPAWLDPDPTSHPLLVLSQGSPGLRLVLRIINYDSYWLSTPQAFCVWKVETEGAKHELWVLKTICVMLMVNLIEFRAIREMGPWACLWGLGSYIDYISRDRETCLGCSWDYFWAGSCRLYKTGKWVGH